MKFVSKQSNYRVVLRPGIPAERMTGRPAVPGLYVKFENGIANVQDEESVEMMLTHPGFNTDFQTVGEKSADPYVNYRKPTEPQHNIQEIKFGSIVSSPTPRPRLKLNVEQQRIFKEMVNESVQKIVAETMGKMIKEESKGEESSVEETKEVIEKTPEAKEVIEKTPEAKEVIEKTPEAKEVIEKTPEAKEAIIEPLEISNALETPKEKSEHVCDVCDRVCASEFGLRTHRKIHDKK